MADPEQILGHRDASAVPDFSPLPRAIFLLHRMERATHAEISVKLEVTQAVVESAIAHVLVNLVRMREGRALQACIYADVVAAEASLYSKFQSGEAAWRHANATERLGLSRALRAWGGTTDFDAWLWYQVTGR